MENITISKEEMFAGIIYQEKKTKTDWSKINEDMRWWMGGSIDSDGCIMLDYKHGIRLSISKAENGYATLETMKMLLGGHIYNKKNESDRQQPQREWMISGRDAIIACEVLKSHLFLKRPQADLASTYPYRELQATQMCPVASKDRTSKDIQKYASQSHAARVTGATQGNIYSALDRPHLSAKNKVWIKLTNPFHASDVLEKCRHMRITLTNMKKVEHESINCKLPPAYVGGLIDGDGSISVRDWRDVYSVGQKYPSICNALKTQYGGRIHESHYNGYSKYEWILQKRTDCTKFRDEVCDFLIEKHEQGKLVKQLTKQNANDIKNRLSDLKGKQGKALKNRISERLDIIICNSD